MLAECGKPGTAEKPIVGEGYGSKINCFHLWSGRA